MSTTNVKLATQSGFSGLWIIVEGETRVAQHWLTQDDALRLAAQLVCIVSVIGEGTASPFAQLLQKFRDRITGLMDELGDMGLAVPSQGCPHCGKVVHNAANMNRHIAIHEKAGTDEVQ